jgi:hypothetical protein
MRACAAQRLQHRLTHPVYVQGRRRSSAVSDALQQHMSRVQSTAASCSGPCAEDEHHTPVQQ